MSIYMCMCTYMCMCVCVYAYMNVMSLCMHICICVRHTQCIDAFLHASTYFVHVYMHVGLALCPNSYACIYACRTCLVPQFIDAPFSHVKCCSAIRPFWSGNTAPFGYSARRSLHAGMHMCIRMYACMYV
jgi:hypothetical protein